MNNRICFTQVNADDDDKGTFGDVYYYLINDFGTFRIDEDFGIITTTTYIDYELIQSYSLTVVANDSAVPSSQQRSDKQRDVYITRAYNNL